MHQTDNRSGINRKCKEYKNKGTSVEETLLKTLLKT